MTEGLGPPWGSGGPPWMRGGPPWMRPGGFGPGRRFRRGAFVALAFVVLLVAALATVVGSILSGNAPAPWITVAVSAVVVVGLILSARVLWRSARSVGVLMDAADLRLKLVVGDDAPAAIDADPVRLTEVLANLLTNAIRHSPAGASVTVRVGSAANRDVVFEVDDDGPGIPSDQVPFVFDRFVTSADTGGTGLGLAIAKRLVEAHGGTIEAIMPNGGGTHMRVRIPPKEHVS